VGALRARAAAAGRCRLARASRGVRHDRRLRLHRDRPAPLSRARRGGGGTVAMGGR
jgi:hypothetical protein